MSTIPFNDPNQTVLIGDDIDEERVCPYCGSGNKLTMLIRNNYACGACNKEIAHVEFTRNGGIRGIFGWLLAPGDVILERYQIKSVLGKGGFGAAYLADDLELSGKRRALKEIPEQMFNEYETSLLSRLDHPAIPDIIERKAVAGMYYLVLKFGGSRTLDNVCKDYLDQRIPLAKLIPWMRQLCEVLIYLHAQTPPIIHRDLKPGNILLDENDRIMLIDFGIAKEAVPEVMTQTICRAASMHFSPPEQELGAGSTDERSDIYAFGATFYALLTGQNPPAASERVAGMELLPPSHFVPEISPEIEAALLQALILNKNHRQQSMQDFVTALQGQGMADAVPGFSSEQAARTVPINQANNSARTRPAAGRNTASTSASAVPGNERPKPQRKVLWALSGMLAILLSFALWVYFYNPESESNSQTVAKPAASGYPTKVPDLDSMPTSQNVEQPQSNNTKRKIKLGER